MTNRIAELRKEKKMSQQQLAMTLNVTQATISGYENGSQMPSVEKLVEIADLFKVSTDYILGRTNIRFPETEANLTPLETSQRNKFLDIWRLLGSKNRILLLAYAQGLLDSRQS